MKKIALLWVMATVVIGAVFANGGSQKSGNSEVPASQKIVIKWGDELVGDHPVVLMVDRIAKEVEQKTNGRVTINFFPGGQLGSGRDQVEAVMSGTQDITVVGPAIITSWLPSIGVIGVPYIWRDIDHLQKVMSGPIFDQLNQEAIQKRNMRILGTTYYGTRHITTRNKPIESLADMKGLKLRVPEIEISRAMVEAWGASPTPITISELYLALQQGVVDGQENPLATIYSFKFYEVQKYLILSGHDLYHRVIIMNEGTFQKMSPEDRKIFMEAVNNGIAWQDADLQRRELTLLDTLKAAGMTVITPDVEALRKVVLDALPKKFGSQWDAGMYEEILNVK
jgi:tripartite ATP-independent transporter DctP family solute receptor